METRKFRLYMNGETIKDKFGEDIIVYDEPNKNAVGF